MTSGPDNEPDPLNFTNWIVILTSIANSILSLILIFMGIQSTRFDYAGLLVVNWTLMSLGFIVLCLSITGICGILWTSTRILTQVFFLSIVSLSLLSVFGIGAITFNSNLLQWVD